MLLLLQLTKTSKHVRGETNRQDHGVSLPRVEASESPSAFVLESLGVRLQIEELQATNCQTIERSVVLPHQLGDTWGVSYWTTIGLKGDEKEGSPGRDV